MTTYKTSSDAANTMIKAFLTKIGEDYLGHYFNTGSGKGKEIRTGIKEKTFNKKCAFSKDLNTYLDDSCQVFISDKHSLQKFPD